MNSSAPIPRIAVLTPNMLAGIGLKSIIEKIIPTAEVTLFERFEQIEGEQGPEREGGGAERGEEQKDKAEEPGRRPGAHPGADRFFHYFVSAEAAVEHSAFFRERLHKTILLLDGAPQPALAGFHSLNTRQNEEGLVRDILRLHQYAHREGYRGATPPPPPASAPAQEEPLTPREIEVLVLITRGFINKEIADRLHIGLTTVISHRRHILEKLGIRSVSALTIYAVTKGYVDAGKI